MSHYQTVYDEELKNFRNICECESYNPDEFNLVLHQHTILG